jgi:dTDP-4-dehydrorhamnose 3,5-epimerase
LISALPTATAFRRADLDITCPAAVEQTDWSAFDVVINAAAFTGVDAAETPQGRAEAWRVNAVGVAHLADAANTHGFALVHISSEYVFDGSHDGPIPEDAPLTPLGAYGASKAAGELAAALAHRHYLVRTTWVVGQGSNFVRTMIRLAARAVSPAVVADQIGRPTFAGDLADAIVYLVSRGAAHGTYHVTNTGKPASWADLARATFALAGRDPAAVTDTTTAAYFAGRRETAARPLNSVLLLDKAQAAGVNMPPWPESLATYVKKEICAR